MTGARALTHRDNGAALNPTTTAQWQQWVSAGRTRNFLLNDTLVDWLDVYGVASDVLNTLFPYTLAPQVAGLNARALGRHPWHYVVVDIKFTTLNLLANWELGNSGSSRAFKGQLHVYTRALGRLHLRVHSGMTGIVNLEKEL